MGFVSLSDDLDNETQLSSQWLRYLSQEILPLSYLIRICRQWCGCDITHSPNIPNIAQWMYFFFFFLPACTTESFNWTASSHRDKNSQTENWLLNNQTSAVITEDDGECFLLTCRREGNSNPYQSPLNFLCFSNCMKHYYVLWCQGSSFAFGQKPR